MPGTTQGDVAISAELERLGVEHSGCMEFSVFTPLPHSAERALSCTSTRVLGVIFAVVKEDSEDGLYPPYYRRENGVLEGETEKVYWHSQSYSRHSDEDEDNGVAMLGKKGPTHSNGK